MRTWLVLAVIVAQIGTLAFMAGEREWVVRTGRTILLRTAPVDPLDPMRGAYVRLDYEIAHVPRALCDDEIARWMTEASHPGPSRADAVVYALLEINRVGVAELRNLAHDRPSGGHFIRGRIQSLGSDHVRVRYGVEALFMEQQAAKALENAIVQEKMGVPINAEVAVNSRGLGVLKGYRWEPLGLTITLRREQPQREPRTTRPTGGGALLGLVVELKNHSESPVAIVDPAVEGVLRLIPDARRNSDGLAWVRAASVAADPGPEDIIVLAPATTRRVDIDLRSPQWHVFNPADAGSRPAPLSEFTDSPNAWFRIEYAPPPPEGLPQREATALVRHSTLRSRAFSPAGLID